MPEPQTLLTVVAPVASGKPSPRAACRAGDWPWPAGSTQPMKASSTRSGESFARSSAALITCEPSFVAESPDSSPRKRPSGVRTLARDFERLQAGGVEVLVEDARAAVADHVERAGDGVAGDREAARQGLDQDDAERVGAARKDKDVGAGIDLRELFSGVSAE